MGIQLQTRKALILVCVGIFCALSVAQGAGPSFMGLGDLEGGKFISEARGVSADGSVVVGFGRSASGVEAFRWSLGGSMTPLGELPGGLFGSRASGVSGDGTVVVGSSDVEDYRYAGFYRVGSSGPLVAMPDLNAVHAQSIAAAASFDGSVIVGQAGSADGTLAFRWVAGVMTGLGNIAEDRTTSCAYGVTPDGDVVVGFGYSNLGKEAFRWTETSGMVGLGDLPGGRHESTAYAVSADGSVSIGYANGPDGAVPVRWIDEGEAQPLCDGPFATGDEARGISGDGHIVVGKTKSLGAFIWDEVHGMRSLQTVLVDEYGLGNELDGWQLSAAHAISLDGTTIVGTGRDPAGNTEAWRAVIPEPGGLLAAFLLLPLALRRAPRARVRPH